MTSNTEHMQRSLDASRFEILPLRGALDRALNLPLHSTITVTSSPAQGVEATLELAAQLAAYGYQVVPHLAARSIVDTEHLSNVLDRMAATSLSEAFVIAGDSTEPAGDFPDALSLLRAMDDMGRKPERIGIGGYPEQHAIISDSDAIAAMAAKSEYADYIVSQMCFDAFTTASWVKSVRARGIGLPVYVGVAGAVDPTKLLRISMKIGLGQSMRFLRKQNGAMGKLLTRYTPEHLFDELAPYVADPEYNIAGWHFYTFNEVAKTQRFREDMSVRLQEVPA